MPRTRIERIAREEKPVKADTALRLGKFLKTGAAFWMYIQARLFESVCMLLPQRIGDSKLSQIAEDRRFAEAVYKAGLADGVMDRLAYLRSARWSLTSEFELSRIPLGFIGRQSERNLPGEPNGTGKTLKRGQRSQRSARGVARAASQIDLQLLELGDALIDAALPYFVQRSPDLQR